MEIVKVKLEPADLRDFVEIKLRGKYTPVHLHRALHIIGAMRTSNSSTVLVEALVLGCENPRSKVCEFGSWNGSVNANIIFGAGEDIIFSTLPHDFDGITLTGVWFDGL